MPRISKFYRIVILFVLGSASARAFPRPVPRTEQRSTSPPLEVMAGSLPTPAMRLVHEWGELHRAELAATWELALARKPLGTIKPLPSPSPSPS